MKNIFRQIIAAAIAIALPGTVGVHAQSASGPLPAQQKDYDKNQRLDYDNATRLHILFSDAPKEYCRTPAVVRAIALLDEEIERVRQELGQYTYPARIGQVDLTGSEPKSNVVTRPQSVAGKEDMVESLVRIKKRLNDERDQLSSYPPCVTGYGTAFANGTFIGLYLIKTNGTATITERFIPTDKITNGFSDSHDPLGVGINIAYAFAPWNHGFVVSPFASLDYLNTSVNHSFPGGSYLGSTANVAGTAGVKIGPSITKDFWAYGIVGVSVLNETLNVNFLPVTSSTSKTVGGATLGAGFAFKPGFLQNLGRPVSLFAEYHHTWWQDAQFNAPAASPLFNYNFRRSDDVVKLGFNVHFDEPAAVAPPTMPVKARPSK